VFDCVFREATGGATQSDEPVKGVALRPLGCMLVVRCETGIKGGDLVGVVSPSKN
jgi:hypothetical protein